MHVELASPLMHTIPFVKIKEAFLFPSHNSIFTNNRHTFIGHYTRETKRDVDDFLRYLTTITKLSYEYYDQVNTVLFDSFASSKLTKD